MTIRLSCPGAPGHQRGPSDNIVHADGCCAAFALMSQERRRRVGRRWPTSPPTMLAIDEPAGDPLTIGELIEVVRLLELAADDHLPAPVPLTPTVHVPHDFPQDQLDALLQLGEAYGLDATCVRLPAPN